MPFSFYEEIALKILYQTYGQEQILDERPFRYDLFKHYLVMRDSLPEQDFVKGGGFIIILNTNNLKIELLIHEK